MLQILLIAIGGAFGSVSRYLASTHIHLWLPRNFPYGTLIVNITGSLIMGFLFTFLLNRFDGVGDYLRSLLLIGFLGGYTTFSSFSIETINLLENGDILAGLMNAILSVVLCLLFTWVGVLIGRQV